MQLAISVSTVVLSALAVLGVVGYLMDRSADGMEG